MTNEQKIKAYLDAGHYVKAYIDWWISTNLIYDNWKYFVNQYATFNEYDKFEDCTVEPIPRKPPYKVWDKVIVLEIAREIDWYDNWGRNKKEQVWKVWSITMLDNDWTYQIDNDVWLPSWAIAPAFDDDKSTKIQELESQLAQIQKEIELLKK